MQEIGEDFANRLQAFQGRIASYEGAWGDDTIGLLIGTAYQAVSRWAGECWATIADEFVHAGVDVTVMAAAFEQADQAVATGLRQLADQLG